MPIFDNMISEQDQIIQLSIILPAYNDAQNVNIILPNLYSFLQSKEGQCEIILVDDGSKDNLYEVYAQHSVLAPQNVTLNLIQFSRNFGKEAALSAGLQEAKGQLVALMDSDGQHPIAVLDEMLQVLHRTDADMVAAVQATRAHESLVLKLYKHLFYRFMQDSQRYQLEPHAGDFRVMKRKVVNALLNLPERQAVYERFIFMGGF